MNLSKTGLALFLILCLCSTIIIKKDKVLVNASPLTLIVPDDYPTIQEAINNVNPGDTIFVRRGTYSENLIINKTITLIGEDRENTVIDGNNTGDVISIQASNVVIVGFTIKSSKPYTGCGIYIERFGNATISNNTIENNGIGIQTVRSSGNKIYENIIWANSIGIQLFYYSSNNVIYRNVIFGNTDGIDIYYYSISNVFYENTICSNNLGVFLLWYSDRNVFYHNNLMDNSNHVDAGQTANTWCFGGEGNYWDDYDGKDLNKDGIGDAPYKIDEKNIDFHPLMGSFYTFSVSFRGDIYSVALISNSTILNFTFSMAVESMARVISFHASSTNSSAGFIRVAIPKTLMENIHTVLINEKEVDVNLLNFTDVKNTYLYIEYSGNCSIKIFYLELLDLYYRLLADYSELFSKFRELNSTNTMLIEKISALNDTLYNFLSGYSDFQKELYNMTLLYQNQAQNFKGLIYIFAAITAVFIATTIYLAKIAHEKQGQTH